MVGNGREVPEIPQKFKNSLVLAHSALHLWCLIVIFSGASTGESMHSAIFCSGPTSCAKLNKPTNAFLVPPILLFLEQVVVFPGQTEFLEKRRKLPVLGRVLVIFDQRHRRLVAGGD